MNTGLTIEWTAEAQSRLNAVFDYLENHWTPREVKKFAQRLEEALSLIIKFPFIYPARFNNRQNPASLNV
ncbi:MAG: type II toxin-antitoxin system RelE/ParE family toxin [Prevotellaceae bacterium]|jgi:plasmid stabilization system protein ParE|nr:type II toxin-antitoxin system RelE/ParE family toxin [Prevotellaceae bacterium]